jgi:hypothetical protein
MTDKATEMLARVANSTKPKKVVEMPSEAEIQFRYDLQQHIKKELKKGKSKRNIRRQIERDLGIKINL